MNAQIETTIMLTKDEQTCAEIIRDTINNPDKCRTLTEAWEWCTCLKGWFIYRGGSHVAVHRTADDGRRVLFVTE